MQRMARFSSIAGAVSVFIGVSQYVRFGGLAQSLEAQASDLGQETLSQRIRE